MPTPRQPLVPGVSRLTGSCTGIIRSQAAMVRLLSKMVIASLGNAARISLANRSGEMSGIVAPRLRFTRGLHFLTRSLQPINPRMIEADVCLTPPSEADLGQQGTHKAACVGVHAEVDLPITAKFGGMNVHLNHGSIGRDLPSVAKRPVKSRAHHAAPHRPVPGRPTGPHSCRAGDCPELHHVQSEK